MPYIYSLAGRAWLYGSTIMRGLVMDFTEDSVARDISDQYMFGPSLMVCPVYEYGATSREVYLPEGRIWYDYYTDSVYWGGQTIEADAPYERIPLFVPSGAVLISGNDVNYAGEGRTDVITLDLYGGSDGRFMFYEDDGTSNAYKNGDFSVIPISFTEDEHACVINIGRINGNYKAFRGKRIFKVRYHMPDRIAEADIEYDGAGFVNYSLVVR
jgi:alpha-D-xyloside xylohydrolase